MDNFHIITNNPAVVNKYPDLSEFHETSVEGIIVLVRDKVHGGAKVLSHPLCGSVKPWESPYKSICVSKCNGGLDHSSLLTIENTIACIRNRRYVHNYTERVMEDFRVIDLDLISSAVDQMV